MVLMLQEADDPDAKLMLPDNISPLIRRLTVDGHSEQDTTEDGDQETTVLISQDPPPSYVDVQAFRERVKTEEEIERARRIQRRFGLALGIALLLLSLPIIIGLILSLFLSSQNEIINDPEPTASPSSPQPPLTHPPWRPWPEPGGGRGPRGPDRPEHGGRLPRFPDDGHERGPAPWFPDEGRQWPGRGRRPDHPAPDDSEGGMNCSDWVPNTETMAGSDYEPSFIITYSFPLNGSISIRSFLSQATGTLRVSLDDRLPEDKASIEVIAEGIAGPRVEEIAACLSTKPGRYSNLWLKAKGSSAESATYSFSLRLPSRAPSYPGLVTDLPRFTQSFDELNSPFDFLDIGGVKSDVSSASLSAKFLSVRTSNGSIDGHFSAEKRLDISGGLKPITITATICDDGLGFAAFARITSSGSPINAKLTLCGAIQTPLPNADDERYGRYRLYVANSDSPISLHVKHSVPAQGSALYLHVTNTEIFSRSHAHTMVSLDSGFEGNFDVRATGTGTMPVSVRSEDATDDQGGMRYVEIERVESDRRSMSGKVFWDSPAPPLDRRGSDIYISTMGDGEASLLFLGG